MNQKTIENIFKIFESLNPNPKTELIYHNEFQLLVAVVLSAQATDVQVNKATAKFFDRIKTPYDIVELGEENLINYIKSIGLYKNKAKNVLGLSQQIVDNHQGQVPHDFEALVKLPGVGRKTANVVLNCLDLMPTIAVDTHVARVSSRIGLSNHIKPEKIEEDLMRVIPEKYKKNAHHWLILHGRYCCTARKPLCSNCKINQFCKYYKDEQKN